MTDALKTLTDWLEKEPNATEVIIIRRRNNDFSVRIEYGNRTTVPRISQDLGAAITEAVDKADRMPSMARSKAVKEKVADHGQEKRQTMVCLLPGMTAKVLPGMG